MRIRIIATPPGEAPEWVREAWIGLSLPLDTSEISTGIGIVSQRPSNRQGYSVNASEAIDILWAHNPEAATWWQEETNYYTFGAEFVFAQEMCAIEESGSVLEMQERQAEYDSEYWQHDGSMEKIRHILLHLIKLTGKMATWMEAAEHGNMRSLEQLIKEVVPDACIYANQLANHFGLNLDKVHQERLQDNIARLNNPSLE